MPALDIANYLIYLSEMIGEPLTNMKLQKLLYYCYAWFLVDKNNEEQLFDEEIQAWQYGPVIPLVYDVYKIHGADNIQFPLTQGGKQIGDHATDFSRLSETIDPEIQNVIQSRCVQRS